MVEHFPESLSSEEKATATNTYAGLEESVNINSLSLSVSLSLPASPNVFLKYPAITLCFQTAFDGLLDSQESVVRSHTLLSRCTGASETLEMAGHHRTLLDGVEGSVEPPAQP